MDTIYQDRANDRFEYFTYSEGRKVYCDQTWVKRELARRTIILRDLNTDTEITNWQDEIAKREVAEFRLVWKPNCDGTGKGHYLKIY